MHFQVYICFIINSVEREKRRDREQYRGTPGQPARHTHTERSTQRPNTFLSRAAAFHTCL